MLDENNRNHKRLIEFIKDYQSLPALWNVKNRDYRDSAKKRAQYKVLLEKYRKHYPAAEMNQMRAKIYQLRSSYKREVKRLKALKKKPEDYANFSILWYFSAVSFLDGNAKPVASGSSLKSVVPIKKKQQLPATEEYAPTKAEKPENTNRPEDDINSEAAIWIGKLKKMDPTQALIASKLITDIIFQGQLGQLNLSTSVSEARMPYLEFPHLPNATFVPIEGQSHQISTHTGTSANGVSTPSTTSIPSPSPRRRTLANISSDIELPLARVLPPNMRKM